LESAKGVPYARAWGTPFKDASNIRIQPPKMAWRDIFTKRGLCDH
jgi:hypothetical protein